MVFPISQRIKHISVLAVLLALVTSCASTPGSQSGVCPQPRNTTKAPNFIYNFKNPMKRTPEHISAGKKLYNKTSGTVACLKCHGENRDGNGAMAKMFDPAPRNFLCANTMDDIPDGQLFWIIKYGSPETSMPPFNTLHDAQIWQLVHYIRDAVH